METTQYIAKQTNDLQDNILLNKSILKATDKTAGLRTALWARISDPSSIRRRGKNGKKETFEELCTSIKLQTDKMNAAADKLEMNVVKMIGTKQHQHSTKEFVRDASDREDYLELEQLIIRKEIDAVMLAYSDRSGRFSPVTRQILDLLRIHGVRLFELEHEYDLNDPQDVLLLGLKAEIDEHHTSTMQLRSYETKLEIATKDHQYRGGRAPYPYKVNPDKTGHEFVVDSNKFELWKKVRAMYQENDGRNDYSIEQLSNLTGLCTSIIRHILFSPIFHTGKRPIHFKAKRAAFEYQAVDMVVEVGGFETIGREDEYDNLHRILNSRKTINRKPIGRPFLLSRMVKCGCGHWMSGDAKRIGGPAYRCCSDNKRGKRAIPSRQKGCGMSVPAEPLEEAFLREFAYICTDPEKLEIAVGGEGKRFQEIQDTIKMLKGRITEIGCRRKDIAHAIGEAKGDIELINALVADAKGLTTDEEHIKQEINRLEKAATDLPNVEAIKNMMGSRIPAITKEIKISNGLSGYTYEDKKRLLSYAFPATHPSKRKYGVTVWKIADGHYKFQVDCILSNNLIGEIFKDDKGWSMEGGYTGKNNIVLSLQSFLP